MLCQLHQKFLLEDHLLPEEVFDLDDAGLFEEGEVHVADLLSVEVLLEDGKEVVGSLEALV
jgi:hypothetical protein